MWFVILWNVIITLLEPGTTFLQGLENVCYIYRKYLMFNDVNT